MTGRNPGEGHRAATPLELLFDLTFVVAFGQAADQLAHFIADDHWQLGVLGFTFALFSACWAWINFSWFASAYDTDDWFYRVTTMVQMIGVVVFALGIPAMFHSLGEDAIDNRVVVAGYVVMRFAMIAQWLRAAKQDKKRRRTALSYAVLISVAQVGWVILAIAHLPTAIFFSFAVLLFAFEVLGPAVAERKGEETPWNAGHIAERYGLLAIIALGEGIFGTVAAVAVLVQNQSWSVEAVLVVVAGVGITFGLWWNYFIIPSSEILSKFRTRSTVWGSAHVFIFSAIAATGAGLHVAAYVIEGTAKVGVFAAIVAVAVPVLIFSIALFTLYTYLVREFDPFHVGLFIGTVVLLVIAVVLAAAGATLGVCLLILTLAPAVTVVGYETIGHRHQTEVLRRALA